MEHGLNMSSKLSREHSAREGTFFTRSVNFCCHFFFGDSDPNATSNLSGYRKRCEKKCVSRCASSVIRSVNIPFAYRSSQYTTKSRTIVLFHDFPSLYLRQLLEGNFRTDLLRKKFPDGKSSAWRGCPTSIEGKTKIHRT